ncbi:MAG: glycine cleavage system protein H [Limosilactobacillus sp.]|uniref:glycine cleavage system protein H n=1 Tax=Limosilactobacillus sp. TaxID=2773925 RepID=UPI00270332EA|nr:glycine cleavage system protein H [Limosilactobacillus sp.]
MTDAFWTKQLPDGTTQVGINEAGVSRIGKLIFIDLPAIGTVLEYGGKFISVEGSQMVTDLVSPVQGTIIAVNEKMSTKPAHDNDWLVTVK